VLFAFLLRQRETGPHGHGLEAIATSPATVGAGKSAELNPKTRRPAIFFASGSGWGESVTVVGLGEISEFLKAFQKLDN
jgi:hypothetical protein